MEERDFAHVTKGGAGKIAQYLSVRCATSTRGGGRRGPLLRSSPEAIHPSSKRPPTFSSRSIDRSIANRARSNRSLSPSSLSHAARTPTPRALLYPNPSPNPATTTRNTTQKPHPADVGREPRGDAARRPMPLRASRRRRGPREGRARVVEQTRRDQLRRHPGRGRRRGRREGRGRRQGGGGEGGEGCRGGDGGRGGRLDSRKDGFVSSRRGHERDDGTAGPERRARRAGDRPHGEEAHDTRDRDEVSRGPGVLRRRRRRLRRGRRGKGEDARRGASRGAEAAARRQGHRRRRRPRRPRRRAHDRAPRPRRRRPRSARQSRRTRAHGLRVALRPRRPRRVHHHGNRGGPDATHRAAVARRARGPLRDRRVAARSWASSARGSFAALRRRDGREGARDDGRTRGTRARRGDGQSAAARGPRGRGRGARDEPRGGDRGRALAAARGGGGGGGGGGRGAAAAPAAPAAARGRRSSSPITSVDFSGGTGRTSSTAAARLCRRSPWRTGTRTRRTAASEASTRWSRAGTAPSRAR